MDPKSQNQPETPVTNRRPISAHFQPQAPIGATPAQRPQPTPVTSAKAAINAMYAEQAKRPEPPVAMSAREAVNAAAQQTSAQQTKSAANLHHGSIQRSMESTRTSASALLRRANNDTKVDTRKSSLDPLARPQPAATEKRPEREVPVVRTSLKLGSAAHPKPAPVVLPPNARMARVARPVHDMTPASVSSGKLSKLLTHGAIDAQIVQPRTARQAQSSRSLASGQLNAPASADNSLTVKIIPSQPATPSPVTPPTRPRPKSSANRDPQMVAGSRRSKTHAAKLSSRAQTAEVLGMATQTPRFRTKPKGFSANAPTALPTDNSYIMAEPPKLSAKKKPSAPEELGVIESYHLENPPQPIGDKAPTGSVKAQKVAAGHVAAAPEPPTIKADNTSNYSFSQKKSEPDNNRYALGGESPFLRSVNVEKRPLSDSPQTFNPKVAHRATPPIEESKTPVKGRKNHYAKKTTPTSRQDLPAKPTVIVPSNRRSKAPLVFLIFITIVLGAAVGAAVYLCFFQ